MIEDMDTPTSSFCRQSILSQIHDTNKQINEQFLQILSDLNWTPADLQRNHHQPKNTTSKLPAENKNKDIPDLRSTREKLADYESAVRPADTVRHQSDLNELFSEEAFAGDSGSATKNREQSFAEIMKQKRDQKRRRMKYRTAKAPVTYTEEIRQLIAMQGEAWVQFLAETRRRMGAGGSD